MESLEQKILDIIQDEFPIAERPYAVLASRLNTFQLNLSEQDVFDIVTHLRESGIIRRIGGVYNSKKLGFISRLCAGKIPLKSNVIDEDALNKFASVVNTIPAITHNYVRDNDYNVWFTVIEKNEDEINKIIDKLKSKTKLKEVHCLSAKKMFKINTVMSVSKKKSIIQINEKVNPLQDKDKERIRLLSGNIPHSLTPFKDLSIALDDIEQDLKSARMRRFGAVLRHQQAGFIANAMVCFFTEDVKQAGDILKQCDNVSHCYERMPFDNFPFNIYAMFHAESKEKLQQIIDEYLLQLGNPKYAVLHSIKELKKTSYTYFE